MANCPVCEIAATNPVAYGAIEVAANGGRPAGGIPEAMRLAAKAGLCVSERVMQSHFGRRKGTTPHKVTVAPTASLKGEARLEIDATGTGTISTAETFDAAIDWDNLIALLGGDPNTTVIKQDTIRVSARQVRVVNEDGSESFRTARSYSASLAPRDHTVELTDDYLESRIAEIKAALRTPSVPIKPKRDGAAFMIAWGDTQVAKAAGGGVEGVINRFFDAIDKAIQEYHDNMAAGYRYNSVFMPIMGDITEGVSGSYEGQLFSVRLNKTDQDLLGFELVCWAIERVRSEIGLPLTVAFVNSNHGEHSRLHAGGGGKNKTSASDTVDRMLGELTKKFYTNDKHITVIVPGGNLVVPIKVNGVNVAIAHGHGIGSRAKATTIQQELLAYDAELTETNGGVPFLPSVWLTAHYHHFSVQDLGPYTWIQTPALDGGSEWFTNTSGRYSRPGLVTASIGTMFEGGIDRIRAIWVSDTPQRKKPSAKERLLIAEAHERNAAYSE